MRTVSFCVMLCKIAAPPSGVTLCVLCLITVNECLCFSKIFCHPPLTLKSPSFPMFPMVGANVLSILSVTQFLSASTSAFESGHDSFCRAAQCCKACWELFLRPPWWSAPFDTSGAPRMLSNATVFLLSVFGKKITVADASAQCCC